MSDNVERLLTRQERARAEFKRLGVPAKAIKALADDGIFDLDGLGRLTERQLARFHDVGKATLAKLRPYLAAEPPRNTLHEISHTVSVNFDARAMTALDSWAAVHGVTRAEAVRRLVAKGLMRAVK